MPSDPRVKEKEAGRTHDPVKIAVSAPAPAADEPEPEPEEEMDEEKRIEERRKKREALLAKFRAGEGPKPSLPGSPAKPSAAQSPASNGPGTGTNTETGATPLMQNLATSSQAPSPNTANPSQAPTPLAGEDLAKPAGAEKSDRDGVSAAEYNERAKGGDKEMPADTEKKEDEWEEVEIEVSDDDDEEMDMFAAFGDEETPKKKRKVKVRRRKGATGTEAIEYIDKKPKSAAASALEIVDNVDDVEGYYRITPGEILDDGRYQITVTLGKGMFSAVVKAKVLKAVGQERHQDVVGREVAIKLMRSQESMYVAGRKEAQVLKLLNDADPGDKKHVVRMERTFEHRGHFCIVTESMSMNLRDVIKRFGKDVGLNMKAVRTYGHQMLLALSLMRRCNIVHADIKPDNVLVSENKAVLKVCDLGTAAEVSAGEITPYLVSRFYRAPEISKLSVRGPQANRSPRSPVRYSDRYVGHRLHVVRAVHGQDPLPWPVEQPHAALHDGDEGQDPEPSHQEGVAGARPLRREHEFHLYRARPYHGRRRRQNCRHQQTVARPQIPPHALQLGADEDARGGAEATPAVH